VPACLRAWAARLMATGRCPLTGDVCGSGTSAAARAALIRLISSSSARISMSVGDSAMVAVTMKVRMLIPRISGSRNCVAVAPFITIPALPGSADMRIAAMPV
jgi:hypothetical protein